MKHSFYISLLIISMLLACTSKKETSMDKSSSTGDRIVLTAAQIKNAGIETGLLTNQTINETLQLNGQIDVPPQNIVSISFPLGGYLRSTHLLPGMHVSKGESIAIIEDQSLVQLQQDYLMTKAKLQLSKLELERQKSLNASKTASDKIYEQAAADYESNRVLLMGLAEKLRLVNINPDNLDGSSISRKVSIPSPISGFVSKVNVNIGKYVQPQDVLFELINPADIHAALTVFEKDINKVHDKQMVLVSFVDEPDKTYEAEIILITKNVDENRSGTIHCHFEKMPSNLRPGMFITGQVQVNAANAYVLPEEAITRFENKEYVFIEDKPNEFAPVIISTGERNNHFVSILDPVNQLQQKKIVTKNAYAVLSSWKNEADDE